MYTLLTLFLWCQHTLLNNCSVRNAAPVHFGFSAPLQSQCWMVETRRPMTGSHEPDRIPFGLSLSGLASAGSFTKPAFLIQRCAIVYLSSREFACVLNGAEEFFLLSHTPPLQHSCVNIYCPQIPAPVARGTSAPAEPLDCCGISMTT